MGLWPPRACSWSSNTPPIQLKAGVRQGDPVGPLLFAFAWQRSLQHIQEVALSVAVIAFADDDDVVGHVHLKVAFQILRYSDRTGGICLRVQQRKCALSGGPSEAAASVAVKFNIWHC